MRSPDLRITPRYRGFVTALLLLLVCPAALAQTTASGLWTDMSEAAIRPQTASQSDSEREIVPQAYRTVRLDRAALAGLLAEAPAEVVPGDTRAGVVLPLPTPDGGTARFRVIESSIMEAPLQARYPEIRTYLGQGIDTPSATVRISTTPDGFRALVLSPAGTMLIDPYRNGDVEHYIVYNKRDYTPDADRVRDAFPEGWEDVVGAAEAEPLTPEELNSSLPENGDVLRTFRLAMAATGEYTAFHSNRAGSRPNVSDGLAAIVVAMARVNGVYEREVAVRMVLVADNDEIVFTDAATDPYTNGSPSALLAENQATLDVLIGSANYDVGHVFSTGGGGLAGLGVVCTNGQKARGETGLSQPIGDVFYIDFVAHELGHQFRGNHSFNGLNGNCSGGNRNASTAYEPGSGSTIMAYAGICSGDNIQQRSDDYFHAVSLFEIVNFVTNGGGSICATETETGNEPPVVTAEGNGLAIPIETAFALRGSATDDTPESLTYVWEEYDIGPASAPPGRQTWNEGVPFFRSFEPTTDTVRYFPQFNRYLAGLDPVIGERLPAVGRTLRFRFTVRDNTAGAGGIGDEQIILTTDADAGPFVVTFANEEDFQVAAGSEQEITWDVAGTNAGDVNTLFVDILFSDDNGVSFDTLLAATENDGSELVTMPDIATGEQATARIMISGTGNVFFDVNDAAFAVNPGFVSNENARPDAGYALSAVYPNPLGLARTRATLNLSVEQSEVVRVVVYDVLGREVAVLHDGPLVAGQNQQFALEASRLAGGVYFVRVVGETFTDVREMTVVR